MTNTPNMELPRALLDAHEAAVRVLEKHERFIGQLEALPDEIRARESEVDALRVQLECEEAESAIAARGSDDEQVAAQRADEVRAAFDLASGELGGLRRRFAALEAHARSLDDEIQAAKLVFDSELQTFARSAMIQLGQELDRALVPARGIIAKMRALPGGEASIFLATAFVPDVQVNYVLLADVDGLRRGYRNLLMDGEAQQPDGFDALLAPLCATQAALRGHRPYQPLATRQSLLPSRSGYTVEHGPAAPPEPATPPVRFERSMRAPGAPLDGDIGAQIMRRWQQEGM